MLDARGAAVPTVIHWGADLGEISESQLSSLADASVPPVGPSSTDTPTRATLVPLLSDGWSGQPGLVGRHDCAPGQPERVRRPLLCTVGVEITTATTVQVRLEDTGDETPVLAVTLDIELSPQGLLRSRMTVTNLASTVFELTRAATSIPLPAAAREQLDFTGTWANERQPQRAELKQGAWLRESRHGRDGHDDPFVLVAGPPGFGFRSGEVWASHLATSGDKRVWLESTSTGQTILGLSELLDAGEVRLQAGQSYISPWSLSAWSDRGLDGISSRYHQWFRALASHPQGPRPLTLNTWEAVYLDHDEQRIIALAEVAAAIGVERFVLDDGWMTDRIDVTRALGDWTVDTHKWPRGLAPLISRVEALGMQFGLWVEPEMVSLNSDLARAHPDWILREHSSRLPLSWRDQHVLDLGLSEVREYIVDAISALLSEYSISYLKWDMNRDLLGGSSHTHTVGLYEILDRLRELFPTVEIESCSSGGARIDAAILERVQRVWPSDTNDPLERLTIERWTALLVPPEYLGSHVGDGTAHTSGRTHTLSFRLAAALFGHAGIEWDITTATSSEREALAAWASQYKQLRDILHTGTVVNADTAPHRFVRGVVSADGNEAVFCVAALATSPVAVPPAQRLPGLNPDTIYRVSSENFECVASGRTLAVVGVVLALLLPEQAIIVRCTAL